MTPEERYQCDPAFHALVDLISKWVVDCDYTPSEVREAAMLAAIKVDLYKVRQTWYKPIKEME